MERFEFSANPAVRNIVLQRDNIRISLLTPCMIRVETGHFTDLPTQTVWNRDLGPVKWRFREQGNACAVGTKEAVFQVDLRHGTVFSVKLADGTVVRDLTGGMLPGTARTLDAANGAVKLEKSILSRSGAGMMDDSKSLLLGQNGSILPRPACTDRYYFAYGTDYLRQLKDFFRITGPTPLIPKYALGNWWSRYRAYTQEEYQTLMQRFIDRQVPITVATIDMDWHWTDVVKRFGEDAKPEKPKCKEEVFYNTIVPGWTGYTWNTELFPDHRALLDWLHAQNFHITLNVHPSQGIRYFEDCYNAICQRMGKNPEDRKLIPFDITDPAFVTAYFDEAHHPLEAEGVDFWWLDWQQGTKTKVPGLDPLWALNHYHTLDMAHSRKRPLTLSRYAGLGSHRYPLGFSGDTIVTWKSLAFQPYFTNCAANAGYTWWSHDIGGHMEGIQDDELYLRWLQYGVFSPINRLHSSNSDFMGKEPWKRSWAVCKIAEDFLRLRHRLIPFLYSANHMTHTEGIPLCMPMYYRYDTEQAYQIKNQYLFGDTLLVCPITEQADKRLNLSAATVWLPDGRWTDLFTGRIYKGGQTVTMYRDLDSIPVLAPEGAIIPMYKNGKTNDLSLEQPLEIHIWRGNGHYSLYEDDGETTDHQNGRFVTTEFSMTEEADSLHFTITPPADSQGLLPEQRVMELHFQDIVAAECTVNGVPTAFENGITVSVGREPIHVTLTHIQVRTNPPKDELRSDLLTRVQGENVWKSLNFRDGKFPAFLRKALDELDALADA